MERRRLMLNRKYARLVAVCAVAATPFVSSTVSAGEIDGTRDVVCALTRVVACHNDGPCLQGQPRTFDLPELIVLDHKEKVLRSTRESGHEEVSPIKNMERNGDILVLQGVENSRGWDLAINVKTGSTSGAVIGEDVSFMLHGTCTAL
jgi:hypothetical protein